MRAPPAGPSLTIPLLYSPKCVEEVFSEVRLSADAVVSVLLASAGACLLVHPPGCILDSACDLNNRKGNSPQTMIVVYGVLVVCGACLAAVVGLTVVQRLVPATIRKEHNDVAGFIYAVLGVIYAVLLALVVIAVWEDFGRARETTEQEANALAEIFWLAHQLPEPEGPRLQELSHSYAQEVVDEEWPLMEQGRTPLMEHTRESTHGWVLIDDIRATLQGYEPRTEAEQELYAEGLDQVQRLADARRMRLVQAEEGLPTVLWVVLIAAGMLVVGFAYFFGMENTGAHALMVVSLAGVIALVLFTIAAMEHPFSGGARVGPEAFELVLNRFETSKLSDL
jgi:drug/metabolite transporter (DMT)-like permease